MAEKANKITLPPTEEVPETPIVVEATADAPEIDELRASVEAARAELESIQAGAKELLERVAAEQAAKADEPSGIEVGVDWNFIHDDPSDPAPYLAKHGLEQEPDKAYGWISADPRVTTSRLNRGEWELVKGGQVKRGDTFLALRPKAVQARKEKELDARRRLMRQAPMRQLDAEGQRTGMETIEARVPR